jgi:chorismate synthase
MSSTLGRVFRLTTFGESHGPCVGAVVDGCPARLALTEADIQPQLSRRRPGQSSLTTPRDEKDKVQIISGVENGLTLGSPVALWVANEDRRPSDYGHLRQVPRPSHADFTYMAKYGVLAASGGGRASARETVGRCAGGAVAEKLLRDWYGVEITAWVSSVGGIDAPAALLGREITRAEVDQTAVRCPDPESAERMENLIKQALDAGDSAGGVITCVCRNVPAGWGEPVFDKIDALLGRAMLSIQATVGFEIGAGFAATRMRGSQHNDPFVMKGARLGTSTNHSGGVQGGITNGEPIVFRVGFKPVATIKVPQQTVDYEGRPVLLENKGRHDPCVLPRAVPIVESMTALVLADMALIAGGYEHARPV